MGKSLYAVVPISMDDFMRGKNPTTQPGQVFNFYATMQAATQPQNMSPQFIYDDYYMENVVDPNYAYCLLKFQADKVHLQAPIDNNNKVVGYGSIPVNGLVSALIMKPSDKGFSECIEVEDGNFEQTRETLLQDAKEAFMNRGIVWNRPIGWNSRDEALTNMSTLANRIFGDYHHNISIPQMNDIYHHTTGTEQDKIIAILTEVYGDEVQAKSVFDGYKKYYENSDVSIHEPDYVSSREAWTIYASAHLACLPNDVRDVATTIVNEKMWGYSLTEDFEQLTERYAATSVAYAIEAVLPVVEQKYPNLLSQVLQHGQGAMQNAIALGAEQGEMMVSERIAATAFDGHNLSTEDVGDNFDELQ